MYVNDTMIDRIYFNSFWSAPYYSLFIIMCILSTCSFNKYVFIPSPLDLATELCCVLRILMLKSLSCTDYSWSRFFKLCVGNLEVAVSNWGIINSYECRSWCMYNVDGVTKEWSYNDPNKVIFIMPFYSTNLYCLWLWRDGEWVEGLPPNEDLRKKKSALE